MKDNRSHTFSKCLISLAMAGGIFLVAFGLGFSPAARAQDAWTETPTQISPPPETPTDTLSPTPSPSGTAVSTTTEIALPASTLEPSATPTAASNDYYQLNALSLSDGTVINEMIIHGPPVPPPGFDIQRQAVSLPEVLAAAGTNVLTVPAYPWVYGCSAVSGAMIAGYYDRNGYSNMYTGPTDGGVMPLSYRSSWGTWVDVPPSPSGSFTYYNNPLVASKNGLDGRTIRGSIDDYWVQYFSAASDPYIGNWVQHAWGDAIGDFMQTSQSHYNGSTAYGLGDAFTRFYDNYSDASAPLTCDTIAYYVTLGYPPDGTLGRKLFYQSKGYTVTDCYNQYTDISSGSPIPGGFSFIQYKAEIDAGRPVMINLSGHTIVGVGYGDPDIVYLNDTWDSSTHSMTWGGSYSGMSMQAVSIVNLAPANFSTLNVAKTGNGSGTVTSNPTGINCGSNCTYAYDKSASVTLSAVASAGSVFLGWSGGGCSGTGTCTVPMSANQVVTASFAAPDLTITSLTVLPASPSTNDDIHLSVDVSNLGVVDSTTFRIQFYVDDSWKSCWYLGVPPREYFARVSGLAGNSSGTWSYTIPAGTLSLGAHAFNATVDMGCEVVEGNEANNSAGPVSATVTIPLPGAFNLTSPVNAAVSQPVNPTLTWAASTNAASYEYCINSTAICTSPAAWTSTGAVASKALTGLIPGTTYYWQVRARNTTGLDLCQRRLGFHRLVLFYGSSTARCLQQILPCQCSRQPALQSHPGLGIQQQRRQLSILHRYQQQQCL